MIPEKLEQELKKGQLNNIYLLYGKEEFLLDSCVKKIKKLFGNLLLGINYIQIDDKNIVSFTVNEDGKKVIYEEEQALGEKLINILNSQIDEEEQTEVDRITRKLKKSK